MVVTGKDHINAINASKGDRSVFHHVRMRCVTYAGMAECDNDLGPIFAHLRDIGLCGGDNITNLHITLKMAAVPSHDLRRHKADDADPNRVTFTRAVGQHPIQHHIWWNQRSVVRRAARHFFCDVGTDHRKACPCY